MLNAGIVDQNIAGTGLPDQIPAFRAFGHIGLDIACAHPCFRGDLSRDRVILLPIGEGVQHHIGARPRHFPRDPQPDP